MSDPILNQGEVIIRKEDAREYVGLERYSAWLYLTSQRIIVKRFIGSVVSYPLSHMTKADVGEYRPSPIALTSVKLLQISFDNDGAIQFGLSSNKSLWVQSIEQAKANAPELPYTTPPPEFTKAASSPLFLWVVLVIISLFSIATCILTLAALFLLRSNP